MKISAKIKPNSKQGPKIQEQSDGSYIIFVREIAAEGKANEALINILSKHFKTSKSSIRILRGQSSKYKIIEIAGK